MKSLLTLLLFCGTLLTARAQTYDITGLKINQASYVIGQNVTANRVIEANLGATNTVGVLLKVTSLNASTTAVTKITVFTNTVDSQGGSTTNQVTVTSPGPLTVGQTYVYYLPGNYDLTTADKKQHFFFVNTVVDFTTGAATEQVAASETFKLRAAASALPVTLTAFTAARQRTATVLSWATAQELGNDRFEVQYSATGTDFRTLASVKGAGTTSAPANYAYRDARSGLRGIAYYRLRQVDFDGRATYSPVVTVAAAAGQRAYFLENNPQGFGFLIPENETPVWLEVVDSTGRTLRVQTPEEQLVLPTPGQNRLFILVLTTKEGGRYTHKVQ